jgi:hypothetical protein
MTVAATVTQAANDGLHGCPGGRGTRPGVARLLECAEDTIEQDEVVTSGRESRFEAFESVEAAVRPQHARIPVAPAGPGLPGYRGLPDVSRSAGRLASADGNDSAPSRR